jgi:hypothetical protein
VGAPISKRSVGQKRKNRIKGCLKVGGNSKKLSSSENGKKLSVESSNVLIVKT